MGVGEQGRSLITMGCNCGGKKQNVDYVVTFKHDGSQVTVGSLAEVRMQLAKSAKGGTYRSVPKSG